MKKTFKEQVIGSWELIGYSRVENGEKVYPLGKDATGFLIYSTDGYMSAQLMAAGRPSYTLGTLHDGTTEEMAAAAHGYHAYSGKYEVDEEKQTLYHHMTVSMIPNRLGQVQDRIIKVEGDRISITSQATTSKILWKRAENNQDNLR